jgi:glutathione S-transferase
MVRPPEKYHEPWVARCRDQMHGALGELEKICRSRENDGWLVDGRMTQADITATCIGTLLNDTLRIFDAARYPAFKSLVDQCEALPQFEATRSKWFAAEMQR